MGFAYGKSFGRSRRQETEEMVMSEEVGVIIVPRLLCHNRPKIIAFCSSCH
ncbi:MAG: hypothetical protein F6K18_33835 [Okeania sp. SIO2C2]|uniref:hypothetical protein n=1 Tax=Okeania sp. SIO2C2 TaxID=2607787 RepID=UPI0013BC89C4|nr:hypothetical protein [Okeania sp. SIO2C2]NEP91382.1 hypothetical protein [Okeania sp. SIO2C2]